jgi:hypothetical protein
MMVAWVPASCQTENLAVYTFYVVVRSIRVLLQNYWVSGLFQRTKKETNSIAESACELYRPSDRCLSAELKQTFANRFRVINARIPYGRNSGFLNWRPYFFFQVAPQLYSRGWVDPVPYPLVFSKSGSVGNRTRTSGSVGRNSDQ